MTYFSFTPVMAEELQPQYFYGAAISQVDMLATPAQSKVSAKYVPSVFSVWDTSSILVMIGGLNGTTV